MGEGDGVGWGSGEGWGEKAENCTRTIIYVYIYKGCIKFYLLN